MRASAREYEARRSEAKAKLKSAGAGLAMFRDPLVLSVIREWAAGDRPLEELLLGLSVALWKDRDEVLAMAVRLMKEKDGPPQADEPIVRGG
jgi:hypothetical protein